MSLTIFIGLQGRTFSSDIFTTPATYYFDGEWAVSNPKNSESEFILQYDGRDNSFSLDTNGLGNAYDYDYNDSFVFFNFDNLAGGCDKTNIGAVEVELFSNDALDAILRQIAFVGNPDPSDSQTPTPSRTRSPAPTASNTPSRTPTPTPSSSIECSLICNCPVFTCHIVYDDDDDEEDLFYF